MSRVLPILFNEQMVRAILDERKTVTRRCVKLKRKDACGFYVTHRVSDNAFTGVYEFDENENEFDGPQQPPYEEGDILYVRETWTYHEGAVGGIIFKARCPQKLAKTKKWRPSIHMPKAAARIWLKVTDVRVERLQEMNTGDFMAEGVYIRPEAYNDPENAYQQAKRAFISIWDSTIKESDREHDGWDANPWVWVIEFERCERPEGQ